MAKRKEVTSRGKDGSPSFLKEKESAGPPTSWKIGMILMLVFISAVFLGWIYPDIIKLEIVQVFLWYSLALYWSLKIGDKVEQWLTKS